MADDVQAPAKVASAITRLSWADKIMFRYIPLCGCISYGGFALYISNASLYKRYCGDWDITVSNSLWFNAHVGMALYMYSSKHLRVAPIVKRVIFTTFSIIMFNFGSVLMWASMKSAYEKTQATYTTLCLISATGLLCLGKKYLDYIDSLV